MTPAAGPPAEFVNPWLTNSAPHPGSALQVYLSGVECDGTLAGLYTEGAEVTVTQAQEQETETEPDSPPDEGPEDTPDDDAPDDDDAPGDDDQDAPGEEQDAPGEPRDERDAA